MLNGIDPIFLFHFKKLAPSVKSALGAVPVVASTPNLFLLPTIPLYLSEKLSGIYVSSESKSLDIATEVDTVSDGSSPQVNQRAIANTVRIEMIASRNSLGVTLLSALSDLVFPKVTSREYAISYLHGAITVFDGLLHSFSINQDDDSDLYRISIELANPAPVKPVTSTVVPAIPGAVPIT